MPVNVFDFLGETRDHLRLALVFIRNLRDLLADDLGPVGDVVDGTRDLFRHARLFVRRRRHLLDAGDRLAHGVDAGEPAETPAFVRERFLDRRRHDSDEKPALRVDTNFQGNTVVVSGETTGARVAVTTPVDSAIVDPVDGEFEATLDIGYGENDITVAAASDETLETAATTVTRFTV